MSDTAENDAPYKVGDRVDSIYGPEHRGTVVEVFAADNRTQRIHVRRDSDGFIWAAWPETVTRVTPPGEGAS